MQKLRFTSDNVYTKIEGKDSFGIFYCGQLSSDFTRLEIEHNITIGDNLATIKVKNEDFSSYIIKKLQS